MKQVTISISNYFICALEQKKITDKMPQPHQQLYDG
ncbi:uncharacterized protein METZ01_LOCUS123211 [marine metagenome]|uniref:Uncharacterized protein n=1 Tax=marine metagenome TaxID=408172 RepID=A0A381Y1Q6_9ZZZZ